MTLGAIVITTVALFVGLGALYLSWRFVSSLPADRPGEPLEKQLSEAREPEPAPEAEAREADAPDARRRTSASEWVAGAAIALGLVGLALFMIRQLGSG